MLCWNSSKEDRKALPNTVGGFSDTTRKGVTFMRITITFHIRNWTLSIVLKRRTRHSAK